MRIITTNFTQESQTTTTASSSNVNYPVSNIAKPFRSKMWRSSGNFVIDSTNNKIDFKEASIGSELTATITSGTYTSTTLAAEIKTQMEAVSIDTFTVTHSSTTGMWTVLSSGSYLSLLILSGTNTATNTLKVALGYTNTDKTGALTYTGANIAIHTSESLVFDMATTEDIDSVVLLWAKEDGIRLSSSAVVKIQANATNNWTSPSVNQTLSLDNTYSTYSYYFTTAQSYRYWRVLITDPTNPNLYVDLGVVVLGAALAIETADNGFSYSQEDRTVITETSYGNRYYDEYPLIATLTLPFATLDYVDMQILDEAYKTNGVRKPVYVAVDEVASVFNKNHFSIYGCFESNLDIGHINYDLFSTELVIKETV